MESRLTDPLDLLKREQELEELEPLVSTGIDALDDMFGGGIGQGLYVFAGPSGVGKTSLLVDIMGWLAKQGKHVIFISQEMSGGQIAKMLCSCFGGNTNADTAMAEMDSCHKNITIIDKEASGGRLSARGCTDLVDKWIAGHPGITPIIMIDHIQRIASGGDDVRAGVVEAIQWLSDYSQKKRMAILLVSQVSGAYRLKSAAKMEAKESVDIAYEAHIAVNMQLKEVNDADKDAWGASGKVFDKALKNPKRDIVLFAYKKRCSGPSSIVLRFDSENCKFSDLTEKTKQTEKSMNSENRKISNKNEKTKQVEKGASNPLLAHNKNKEHESEGPVK